MSLTIKKGPAILSLLLVATAIITLGIFLDGKVIAPQPDNDKLIKEAAVESALEKRKQETPVSTEPSEVSQQLERAITAANQTETDTTERLEKRVATSKALIEETNQLLVEKGVTSNSQAQSEKSQQFNQQIDDLKARLNQLKSSD
jgi:hypothetical protein